MKPSLSCLLVVLEKACTFMIYLETATNLKWSLSYRWWERKAMPFQREICANWWTDGQVYVGVPRKNPLGDSERCKMLTKFSACGVLSAPGRRTHICNQRLLSPQDFLGTVMESQPAICLIPQDIYLTRGSNALRLARLGLETRWNGSWNGFVLPLLIMTTDHIDDFLGRYHQGRNEYH